MDLYNVGLATNSVHDTIHITGRRSSSIEASMDSFVNQTFVISFTWKIISASAVFGNASCGTHIDLNGTQICQKQWNKEECKKSSTRRELSAVEFALESFLPIIQGSYIKWFSDNQAACSIVKVGSMRHDLHLQPVCC